jgi:hypothetical protein
MLVLAGPVFTEWYGIPARPLFALLLFGPPVSVVAVVLYLLPLRRLKGRLARIAAAYALAIPLVVGGWAVVRAHRHQQQEEQQARALPFTPLKPRDDAGFRVTKAEVYEGIRPSLEWVLERDGARIAASQHALDQADLVPPTCGAGRAFVSRFGSFNDRPCTAATTPGGLHAVLAREESPPGDRVVLAVVGGSLVEASTLDATDADLLAWVDALEPGPIDYEP